MQEVNYKNILDILFKNFPDFTKTDDYLYIKKNGSGNIHYIVMGVFTNYYIDLFKSGKTSKIEKANIFLESLSASSDDKLKELLMFGFLEYLNPNEDYYDNIVGAFGPKTKVLLKETVEHNQKLAESVDPELKI